MNDNDIAIIGMSGRFPGAKNVAELWENLCTKRESLSLFSDEELRAGGVEESLLKNPSYVKKGFVLDAIDLFDADFFHISPREAAAMDPQQRLLLECSWEALKDGGYSPGEKPLNVGVFVGGGAVTASYLLEYLKKHPEVVGTSGNFHTFATDVHYLGTRISYKLNLSGPSLTVQTACSTSLVAVHLGCEALLRGECAMALAGGISLRIPHRRGYLYSEGDILSIDGHCRTFDARSSGTVFGSGAGVVLLKKYSQAVADADPIYAVIKGSAINNDGGAKLSYPAPSVEGQASCIRAAFARAKVDPGSVQFVETHGTGTAVGDPIEVQALQQVLKNRSAIGSLKPNIGHLTSAAGIASLIKLSLALYHKKIPAQINFQQPNPKIDFAPFYINTETIDWAAESTPRRGVLSSFGVGGTNACAILEEAPLRRAASSFGVSFQRKRHWVEIPQERAAHFPRIHPLLGWKINLSLISDELLFENILQPEEIPYLKDHQILDQSIFPAAAYIEMFCAAAQAVGLSLPLRLSEVEIKAAMPLSATMHLQTKLKSIGGGYEAGIYRFDQGEWHPHASARITPLKGVRAVSAPLEPSGEKMTSEDFYRMVVKRGYQFGPYFQTLRELWKAPSGFSTSRVATDDATELYTLYPPLLDGATQLSLVLRSNELALPVYIGEIHIWQRLSNSIRVAAEGSGLVNHLVIHNLSGDCLVEIREHTKKRVDKSTLSKVLNNQILYREVWQLSPPPSTPSDPGIVIDEPDLQSVIKQLQTSLPEGKPIFVLSRGLRDAQHIHPMAPFTGLHRALKQEFPDHRIVSIDFDTALSEERAAELLQIELTHSDGEPEILLREDGRYVNRIVSYESLPTQPSELSELREDEVEIAVQASALNFRDVLNAHGLYPGESGPLGSDLCGTVIRKGAQVKHLAVGQSVFGIAPGTLKDRVITPGLWVVPKPERLSAMEAAGLPIVFLTVYHALADLCKNDRILIHTATGGVGLAAIQIAKQVGAEIFATASTPRKRGYLQALGITNIASSRTLEFVDEWKGKGINVVLNSLTGDGFIEGALQLCAPKARFFELSRRNIWTQEQVAALRPDVNYSIVAIDAMKRENPEQIQELLQLTAAQAKPLPQTVFPLTEVKAAFEYLHQARQIGKVVIKHPTAWQKNLAEGSYLITGGFGALGIQTADWLIDQGAKYICLVGRKVPLEPVYREGVKIVAKSCDMSREEEVDRLFREWDGPPLKGIVHAAGNLYNASFLEHTWADFEKLFAPKIQGAWALHHAICKYRFDPDWIVYYSSTSAFLGGHGSAAYSAANSFLDQFARYQQQLGLPAISVNWGAWSEAGMALGHLEQMQHRGNFGLSPAQAFQSLAVAMKDQGPNIGVMNIDWDLYTSTMVKNNPRFNGLKKKAPSSPRKGAPLNMQDYLTKVVQNTLRLPEEHPIDVQVPFIQQGIDSLHAIEFLSQIERDLRPSESLRMRVLQDYPTIALLSEYLLRMQSPKVTEEWVPLSKHMKAYWDLFRLDNYNIGTAVRFPSGLDVQRLHEALNEVLKQHPIFYLSISLGEPVCKRVPYQPCSLHIINSESDLGGAFQKSLRQPFGPSDFPQCRFTLYRLPSGEFELQIVCPHMISDGRSIYLLLEAIDQAYTALPTPYSPLKDFLVQETKYDAMIQENREQKKVSLQHYHARFRPFRLPISLWRKRERTPPIVLKYSLDFRQEFTSACQTMGIQVSLALNGLIALALSWMTDQTEFSATCASNGLFSTDFLNVMGPFHKTLPLHIFRKKSDSLHDFIERLKEMQPLWMHLREYPFDLLVRAQNKKIVKKLLPKKILPLLRILRRLWSRQINLFINELELKSFAHFSDVHSERLPHRGQNDPFQIKVLSLLSQKDWEVHIIWPLSPDNQRQLSKNIDSLLNEFTQKILVK